MEESDQVLLLQIQEEIAFLEEQLSVCEDEELVESIASRLRAVKRRGAGIAKRAAIGAAAAAALASGGAAQAADWSADVNVSRGAVPAQATDQSVRGAVDRALANPGQAQSASSEKGRMKTTVSGGINVSGRFGGDGNKKEKKDKDKEVQQKQQGQKKFKKPGRPDKPNPELAARKAGQQARRAELLKKNKFTTKYRYAVPSSVGGKSGNYAASGANQMTDFKAKGTNRTGGTNYVRTKVVGDPMGSGGTGRTISQGRYNRLFGKGGRYEVPTDGSTRYIPSKLGKKFNTTGYQPNKFVR
jgi:hypothetical protein